MAQVSRTLIARMPYFVRKRPYDPVFSACLLSHGNCTVLAQSRTASHDVLKIAVRPYVKPQEQGELTLSYTLQVILTALLQIPCDLHTYFHELKKSYTNPKNWNGAKIVRSKNRAGGYDSGFYIGLVFESLCHSLFVSFDLLGTSTYGL